MRRLFVFTAILMVGVLAYGASSNIITCNISNDQLKAHLRLDAVGAGYISIFDKANKPISECSLKLLFFADSRKAIVPHVRASFEYFECIPEVKSLRQQFLPDLTLIIDIKNNQKTQGRVQWLNNRQPDKCDVQTLRMKEIAFKANQWRKRKWGNQKPRRPSSKTSPR